MLLFFQIFVTLFCLFALNRVVIRYRTHSISGREIIIWFIFWVSVIFVVLVPSSTAQLAKFFGIGRGVDLAMYLSLMFLFYIVFRLVVRLEKIEHQLTKIVRKIALEQCVTEKNNNQKS